MRPGTRTCAAALLVCCCIPHWLGVHGSAEVRVGSSLELWEACMERNVTTIYVTTDLRLRPDEWPSSADDAAQLEVMLVLGRNVTIEKAPELSERPTIDLDYMRMRVGIGENQTLVVRGLKFVRSTRDHEGQLGLEFFSPGPRSVLVYEDVIAEVAVNLRRPLGLLQELRSLPRPNSREYPFLENGPQKVEVLDEGSERCVALSGRECPSGAVFVTDFANIVKVIFKDRPHIWGAILVHRNTFLKAVDMEVEQPLSSQEIEKEKIVVVRNAMELGMAVEDPEVRVVNVWQDISFGMSVWPNKQGLPVKELYLGHDVTIRAHPMTIRNIGMPVIDFNFMEGGLRVVNGTTLTLQNVFLDRAVRNSGMTLLPFFLVEKNSELLLHEVVVRTPVDVSESGKTMVESMLERTTSGGPDNLLPNFEALDDSACKQRVKGPCDKLIFVDDIYLSNPDVIMGSKSTNPRTMGKDLPSGEGPIVASKSHIACFYQNAHSILSQEEIDFQTRGFISVQSEIEFRTAMNNMSVAGIHLIRNLNLSTETWPQASPLELDRDLKVTTHPASPVAIILDFDFMSNRVIMGKDSFLGLEWLNFTRVSRRGENLHYLPFFSWQDNSTLISKDVLAQMAVEPDRTGALDDGYLRSFVALPPPMWFPDPNSNFTVLSIMANSECMELAGVPCNDGALYISQGVQQVSLKDVFPRNKSRTGTGVFFAYNMLLLADNLERKELLTREETEAARNSTTEMSSGSFGSGDESSVLTGSEMIAVYTFASILILTAVASALVCHFFKKGLHESLEKREKAMQGEEMVVKEHQEVAAELLGDVTLGALLGIGGFARVYRATWNGAHVAVKVILHRGGNIEASIEWEASLSTMLRHPHLVQGYHNVTRTVHNCGPGSTMTTEGQSRKSSQIGSNMFTVSNQDRHCSVLDMYSRDKKKLMKGSRATSIASGSSNGSLAASILMSGSSMASLRSRYQAHGLYRETWLVQEFCDRGSLLEALQNGNFGSPGDFKMDEVFHIAQDICRGMKYLHDRKVIHGDLKSSNVLLQSSATDPRGYIAKVADFGLSRQMMTDRSHLSTSSFGTVTHMPPEVLMKGHLSYKSDVYSFGMILWEMVSGELPFRNMMQMEVMRNVVLEKRRPEIPDWVPDEYRALIESCWCHEPHMRATFQEVLGMLDALLNTIQDENNFSSCCSSE